MDQIVSHEFAARQHRRALEHIWKTYRTYYVGNRKNTHPLLQLISRALRANQHIDNQSGPDIPIGVENWDTWIFLVGYNPVCLIETLLLVMERGNSPVPNKPKDLQIWASFQVLLTLDDLDALL